MADGIRVLIVDDDAEIRALVTAVLGEAGAEVAESASGTDGMARLGRDEFDVALLDIHADRDLEAGFGPDGGAWTAVSTKRSTSNVYFLRPAAPEPSPVLRGRRLPARLRLLAVWWRVRLTTREITGALRRFGRPPLETDTVYLEGPAEIVQPAPRVPAGPARVLRLDEARRRPERSSGARR